MVDVPKFSQLPHLPEGPKGCAWDVWNAVHKQRTGKDEKDLLGTLNHLTPAVVNAAGAQIKTGNRAALNWGLDAYTHVGFNRKKLEHKKIDGMTDFKLFANDDEISFNTQISSQWDGLFHFGHQKSQRYYNGVTHEEMQQSLETRPNCVGNWTKTGGIVGRGVLIDYARWAENRGMSYNPASTIKISPSDMDTIAASQGVVFEAGDILIVRTGWLRFHDQADEETLVQLTHDKHDNIGIEAGEATAAWIWDHRFAGVAADNPTFEAWPPSGDSNWLHEYLLAGLGCPIGELWDLEALSHLCASQNRWTFFLTSAPLNIKGAIASPCNALAVM